MQPSEGSDVGDKEVGGSDGAGEGLGIGSLEGDGTGSADGGLEDGLGTGRLVGFGVGELAHTAPFCNVAP